MYPSFVICNQGYTIERFIHGMHESYNDVHEWKYKDLVSAFGGDPAKQKTYQVRTKQDAEDLFNNKRFASHPHLQFVELYMPKEDAPKVLKITAKVSAETNARQ